MVMTATMRYSVGGRSLIFEAVGMHAPSVHVGHQLIRVGKIGHFLEQPLKFDAVLGHARCIDLFLKVWAVLLPGDRRRVGPAFLLWTPRLTWRRYGSRGRRCVPECEEQ